MFSYGGQSSYKSGLRGMGDTVSLTPYFSQFDVSASTPAVGGNTQTMTAEELAAVNAYLGPDPGNFTNIYGNSPFNSPQDFIEWLKENQTLLVIGAVLGFFILSKRR